MATPERLLWTMAETAQSLGISAKTLLPIVRAGDIRFIIIGRRRMFTPDDVRDFIRRQTIVWENAGAKVNYSGSGPARLRDKVIGFEEARLRRRRKSQRRRICASCRTDFGHLLGDGAGASRSPSSRTRHYLTPSHRRALPAHNRRGARAPSSCPAEPERCRHEARPAEPARGHGAVADRLAVRRWPQPAVEP